MKVFNLACEHDHRFEGWFGSAEDYDSQLERGLLCCPICDSREIRKLPAAPRLNLGATEPPPKATARDEAALPTDPARMQAMMLKMARYIIENSEDVGERFAAEARRIHENEAPRRSIRGVATKDEVRELVDDGIEVFSFPLLRPLKDPLQ